MSIKNFNPIKTKQHFVLKIIFNVRTQIHYVIASFTFRKIIKKRNTYNFYLNNYLKNYPNSTFILSKFFIHFWDLVFYQFNVLKELIKFLLHKNQEKIFDLFKDFFNFQAKLIYLVGDL